MRNSTEIDSIITKSKMRKGHAMRYTLAELNRGLDLIEEGIHFQRLRKSHS